MTGHSSSVLSFLTKSLALLALASLLLAACDFNIELTDEKRVLDKIEGAPRCEPEVRIATGSTHTFRLYLVDDHREAIDLDGIDQEPFNLKLENFTVGKASVYNAKDGTDAKDVTAKITLDKTSMKVKPNPRYVNLKAESGNQRVPQAAALLIDMSSDAARQDSQMSRTSAPASWILSEYLFNEDTTRGAYDIFAALLFSEKQVNSGNLIFRDEPVEKQYIASDGRKRGFLYTDKDNKNTISIRFTSIPNSRSSGPAPLYDAVINAVQNLRAVVTEGSDALFNPGVIAISISRDACVADPNIGSQFCKKLSDVEREIKGQGRDNFIPVMAISYPRPTKSDEKEDAKLQKQWDQHRDDLCSLARAGGVNRNDYWGNLFQVEPRYRNYQQSLRNNLEMATHAMKGYLEVKISFSLSGNVKKGHRYLVIFTLSAEFLEEKSQGTAPILFEVEPK